MNPPRIFNAVFEPVTIGLDGHHPNRVLQFEFEFLANAAVILGDMYFLALEGWLCHEASRVEGSNSITPQDSSTSLPHPGQLMQPSEMRLHLTVKLLQKS
jgi:hypothetical protein